MADDDPPNIVDTNRRFEVFVPKPKARLNLGASNTGTATGPFAYPGVSVQADDHIFLDANRHFIVQSRLDYCGQTGGQWLQFSTEDMVLSTKANASLSAKKRILIAAGAGQGSEHMLDHGSWPRFSPYNSLNLHYRVDRLQTSLFEFFHGRRKRNEHTGKLATFLTVGGLKDDTKYFDGKKKAKHRVEKWDFGHGFIDMGAKSLRELYPVAAERKTSKVGEDTNEAGDPVLVLDPLAVHGVAGKKRTAKDLKYGFSGYLTRFDPYRIIDKAAVTGPVGKGLVGFLNAMTVLKRFVDVTEQYAWLITDNFLAKRVQAAFAAYTNLMNTVAFGYGVFKIPFGSFADPKPFPSMTDEASSGLGSRFKDRDSPVKAGEDAADALKDRQASVQSDSRGPWDLRSSSGVITVEWGPKDHPWTCAIDLGAPASARLDLTIDNTALPSLTATVRVDPAAISSAGTTFDAIKGPLAQLLGLTDAELAGADTVLGAPVTLEGPSVYLVRCTAFDAEELLDVDGTPVTVEDIGTRFTFGEVTAELEVSVDGGIPAIVRIGTAGLSPSVLLEDLAHTALSGLGGVTAGSLAAHAFSLTTTSTGESASIEIGPNAPPWVYTGLGVTGGQVVRGQAPIDLSAVTAEQIAGRIAASQGLSVTSAGGVLTITAPSDRSLDPSSYVKVSGGGTNAIFDSDPKTHEIAQTSDALAVEAGVEAGLGQLRSWNHELAKVPEDTRNLVRPIRQAVARFTGTLSALEKAVEKAVEVVASPLLGLPAPPETIGLIADEGIVMGTRDRIVGAGGKGVVFICDGGSGGEDHQKFIKGYESFVNLALKWDPIDAAVKKAIEGDKKDDTVPSMGFRVLSNDTVDLLGSSAAQLMALGRAKLTTATPDGETKAGIGIVRVAGSHAVEVAGYRKIVISARNRGDDDKTGGRVEVAGQTIAIGGMNLPNDTKDFDAKGHFGIEPFDVDLFAGAEHLSQEKKDRLAKDLATYAWSDTLRKGGATGHPNTQRVLVHAQKEAVVQVGTYLVFVDSQKGVMIGTRKPDPDATKNELDDTLPSINLDGKEVRVSMGEPGKDSTLLLQKDSVLLWEGPTKDVQGRAQLQLKKGVARLYGGSSNFEAKEGTLHLHATKLDTSKTKAIKLTASGKIEIG